MPPAIRKAQVAQLLKLRDNETVFHHKEKVAVADVNAGFTILPAIPQKRYQLVSCQMISEGGAAAGATTVDLLATQAAAAVKLVASAVAGLTQNAVLVDGHTNAAVLAAAASYDLNDVNTAITLGKTGATLTGTTFLHLLIAYKVIQG